MPGPRKPRFLTTLQAAQWFGWDPATKTGGFSPATLRSWRLRKMGPKYTQPTGPRGKALYRLRDLKAWAERNGCV